MPPGTLPVSTTSVPYIRKKKKTTWAFMWHPKPDKVFSDQLVPKMQGVGGEISISPPSGKYSLYLAYKFNTVCY